MLRKRHLVRRIRHVIRRITGRAKPVRMLNTRPVKPVSVEHGFSTVETLNAPHVYHPERDIDNRDDGTRKTHWQ